MNSSPGPNGRRSESLRARISARSARCSRNSCVKAAADGEVDVISAYTSDGQIAKYDLLVLDDPRHAIPPYDAILLLSPRRANDEALIAALKALLGAIPVDLMRAANARAAGGDSSAEEAARWLEGEIRKAH